MRRNENIVDEILKSEFPQQLQMKSKDGKKVILSFKNGKDVIISHQKDDGDYDSEIYEFNDVADNVVWPDSPDFPEYLAKLNLNLFDGVANSDSRDDYNNNIKHVQETMNSMVDYSLNQKTYFTKLKTTLSDLKTFILKLINLSVSNFMHENVEKKYYNKDEINTKNDYLQAQIDNINNAITYKPDPNGVQPPSYTGPRDINDPITDPAIKKWVDDKATGYQSTTEDTKGDNN